MDWESRRSQVKPASDNSSLSRHPVWPRLLVGAPALGIWVSLVPPTISRNNSIYTWDSAAYLETAESLLTGRGLAHRVINGLGSSIWEPLSLWPPGYPLLIAAVEATGLPGPTSCVLVSVAAASLSVVVLSLICVGLFHWTVALPLTLTVVLTDPFLWFGTNCLSESTFFLLSVASAGCVLQASRTDSSALYWMLGAGMFAGAAWGTRYVGIALFAATAIYIASHLLWLRLDRVAKLALAWSLGAASLVVPVVVRNAVVGSPATPFGGPPTQWTIWENVRHALATIVGDLTTSPLAVFLIVNKYTIPLLAGTLLATVALAILFGAFDRFRALDRRQLLEGIATYVGRNKFLLFLVSYVVIYAAVIVWARCCTKYQYGDPIGSRYMVQIYWAILFSVALAAAAGMKLAGLSSKAASRTLIGLFVVTSLIHFSRDVSALRAPANMSTFDDLLGPQACPLLGKELRHTQIVLADRAGDLRVHCNVNARKILPVDSYDNFERKPLTPDDIYKAARSGLLWGVVIAEVENAQKGELDTFFQNMAQAPQKAVDFERIPVESKALFFRYAPKR